MNKRTFMLIEWLAIFAVYAAYYYGTVGNPVIVFIAGLLLGHRIQEVKQ